MVAEYGKNVFEFSDNSITVTIPFDRLVLENTPHDGINTPNDTPHDTPHDGANTPHDNNDTPHDFFFTANETADKIIEFCEQPKNRHEILNHLGLKDRKN